jgi:hypothetical protein
MVGERPAMMSGVEKSRGESVVCRCFRKIKLSL